MATEVSWSVSKSDSGLIAKIVDRMAGVCAASGIGLDRLNATMDLTACHANGCPLDLERMLTADVGDVLHDYLGINAHLDHSTGTLGGCFVPRFATPTNGGA